MEASAAPDSGTLDGAGAGAASARLVPQRENAQEDRRYNVKRQG